jgi:hypothetical protein
MMAHCSDEISLEVLIFNNMTMLRFFNLLPLTMSDLILLLTAVIVWIYTRAAQKANELQISPAITLTFEDITQNGSGRNG